MKRKSLALLLLACLMLAPLALAEAPAENPFLQEEAVTINCDPYDLKQLEGKPLFINFWSTQCIYCVKELPILSELSEQYKDRLVILGVALDAAYLDEEGKLVEDQEELDAVRAIYEKEQYALVTLKPNLLFEHMEMQFDMSMIPVTLLLDASGKLLVDPIQGSRTKEEWTAIIEEMLRVLEAPAA